MVSYTHKSLGETFHFMARSLLSTRVKLELSSVALRGANLHLVRVVQLRSFPEWHTARSR